MSLARLFIRRHLRDTIRDADTLAGSRVYDDRPVVMSRKGEIPAVRVLPNAETGAVAVTPHLVYDRTFSLYFDLYVRREEFGEIVLDLAECLAHQVEAALELALCWDAPDAEIPGLTMLLDASGYRETQFDVDGFGQTLEGGIRIVYDVAYRLPAAGSDEDQALRKFLSVGLSQIVEAPDTLESVFQLSNQ